MNSTRMALGLTGLALTVASVAGACSPAYVDVAAPSDASFVLVCEGPAGLGTPKGEALQIQVQFANVARRYNVGCSSRAALAARLQTIKDLWCSGLDVPTQQIGPLTVGTTVSEISKKRGATIDDGEGYVAFQCGDWLPKLINTLKKTSCCAAL